MPRNYFIAPNGIKIDMSGGFGSLYALKQLRNDSAIAFQVPKNILFPDKELVSVTIKEPSVNTALTYELNNKGSVEVKFNYEEFMKEE